METSETATRRFTGLPGNRRDRERFAELNPWAQDRVCRIAFKLYDGTRTVARCWTLALEAVEEDGAF